jgi:hypothetical protein
MGGGEQRLFADPRTIPAQPSIVISGMAAFAPVDPVTASKYGVTVFCLPLRWGPQRAPIRRPRPYMSPITFRMYKFSLEGLGKASSAQEARRAAASIAGCMSLTTKYGRLTVGPCFLSRPARLRREPRPTSAAPCRNSPTTSTSDANLDCRIPAFSVAPSRNVLSCFFAICQP